jgi:hypothetical protein
VTRGPLAVSARRWGPYALAGALLLVDFLLVARGLSHAPDGRAYALWALDHSVYSDVVRLGLNHYVHGGQVVHPLPYVHSRIEYPVLLGFTLWLPTWLPGGPASWLAATGVLTAAATFGSIALLRRQHPASAWWIAASPALLLDAGVNWDLIGVVFLVAGVVCFGERRYRWSGGSTAAGTCFKLFPVVVAPMALAALGGRWWRSLDPRPAIGPPPGEPGGPTSVRSTPDGSTAEGRAPGREDPPARALARWLIPFTVVIAVVMVPFLILAPSNTLWFVRFNSLRPQKDSLWELVGRVLGHSAVTHQDIDTLSLLAVMVAMAYGAWRVWRADPEHQGRAVALGSAMALIAWMAVNKVWNPQYILWVFAAGALASMPARFGVALGALSVYDWWFEFGLRRPDHIGSLHDLGTLAVVGRMAVLAWMATWTIGQLRSLGTDPVGTFVEGTPAPAAS